MTYNAIDLADTISGQISNGTYALETGHYDEAAALIERMQEDLNTFSAKYSMDYAGVLVLLTNAADAFAAKMDAAREQIGTDHVERQWTIGKVHLEDMVGLTYEEQAVNIAESYWGDDEATMDLSIDDLVVSEDRYDFTVTLIHKGE